MSVVGFDLGSDKSVIAVARRRGIDVLQNEIGKRKTLSWVGYGEKQRFLGDDAFAQRSTNIKNTVNYFTRFLGKKFNDPSNEREAKYIPYKTCQMGDRVGIEVNYENKPIQLLPEQVTAAMLQKLKSIAEAGLDGNKVSDCVIACPAYWTDANRRAMLDAAKIAGLNVLRLMNSTTATALNYGILRNFSADTTTKVMFMDTGHTQTTITVVSFTGAKLQVLGTVSDPFLGGRDFDQLLVDHFAKYIQDKYKLDVLSNAKASMKLRNECARVKLILSTNQKVPFNVEYIMNDTDVTGVIERSTYEEMATPLVQRFKTLIDKALKVTSTTKEELGSIEIVGGGLRTPMLQAQLGEAMGKPLSKTCDSDESVVRGCAWQCAMLSPNFRVREFEIQDASPYPVEIQWGPVAAGSAVEDKCQLFEANNTCPSVKMISFKDRVEPFKLTAKYAENDCLPIGTEPLIGEYVVSGMPAADPEKPAPKIKVRVKLDIHGIVDITNAQALHVVEEEEKDEKEDAEMKPADAAEAPAADAAADGAKADEGKEADKAEDKKEDGDGKAKMDTSEGDDAAKEAATPSEENKEEKKKKKVKREDLKVECKHSAGLTIKALNDCAEKEGHMLAQDEAIAATHEARNALESYVLEMQSNISDSLSEFIQSDAASKFNSEMLNMEDWLYDEGADAMKSEYKKKLAELKKTGDPVEQRAAQHKTRPERIASLKSQIGHWSKLAASTEEKYSHITEEERKKVTDECAATDTWLANLIIKQDQLEKFKTPILTTTMLDAKKEELSKSCSKVMNKKKPPPPKPKEEPKPEKKEEAAPAAAEGEGEEADKPAEDAPAAAETADAPEATAKMDTAD